MVIGKQKSQIRLTKKLPSQTDEVQSVRIPQTFNSLGSLPSNAIITIDDDEEKETLEPKKKKKKQRLGSWWDDVDASNELSCVVKAKVDYHDLHETKKKKDDERSSLLSLHDNFIDFCEDKSYNESSNHKENQDRVGYGHVALEELGVSVEDLKSLPWKAFDLTRKIRSETMDPRFGGYVSDMLSPQ